MPTGYTAAIEKGITFKQFALDCARAFGALIAMRDEPADAVIPDEFQPSDYNQRCLDNAMKLMSELKRMSLKQCAEQAKTDFESQTKHHLEGISKGQKLLKKYEAMLEEVNDWEPPSKDHEELKKFMAEQIQSSINFDCDVSYHDDKLKELRLLDAKEWKKQAVEKAMKDIAYHSKAQLKENQRVAECNKWLRQLRESL